MGWPIRYRLRNKVTGKLFLGTDTVDDCFIDGQGCPVVVGDTNSSSAWVSSDFDMSDHYLEVALTLNEDGTWNYIRLGEE